MATSCDPTDPSAVAGTDNECSAYVECAQRECTEAYQTCMGDNFESGDFSGGACEDYMECATGCDSGGQCDEQCASDCYMSLDSACQTCLINTIGSCVFDNCGDELSECSGGEITTSAGIGGSTGSGGTCEDLAACCASLSGEDQTNCETIYQAAMAGGDFACGAALQAYADQC